MTEFHVRVEYDTRGQPGGHSGWTITVTEHESGRPYKGLDFAKVNAGDLHTAMSMAVPYFVAAAEPNPLDPLLRAWAEREDRLRTALEGSDA